MANLIREQAAGVLDRREWWSLKDSYEAMVVYGKDVCSVHITNSNREDVTKELAEKLKAKQSITLQTTSTIDSFFVECNQDQVMVLIKDLESVC
ncbi:MAG: hypothetical protein OEZ58_14910 [Gammaproteobacteria bacterium]|nr:hypothetical protein [Gammaproteobacteria bacterium]MDH5730285.1 hypothetical protein [Gammaproteobacteria bacterium]